MSAPVHDHDPELVGCRRCGALPFEGVPCEPPEPMTTTPKEGRPMRTPCARCGYVHSEHTATAAVGLFSRPTPMYRADYAGSPLRATRAEAHADMCDHNATLPKENNQ